MRTLKIIIFNILGVILGILAGNIAATLTSWLLIDVLGNFKILTVILSWPVDYSTYAFTGIITAVAASSLYSCAAICKIGKGNFNFGCIIVGLYEIAVYMISFIKTISEYGFNFDFLWMIVVTLATFAIFSFSTTSNNEL